MITIDHETLRVFLERRQRASLWGADYWITPRLVEQVFGDGQKLISIQTIDHRPNFYYARIDSKWSTSNWDHVADVVPADWVDDVIEAAMEQFGDCMDSGRENDPFPVVSADNGFSWQEENWPDELLGADRRLDVLRYFLASA